MTTFNRRQTLATMGAAAAVGLAAPAVAQGKKITLGALRFTSHSGTFVAYQREYFKQAGLDVDMDGEPGGWLFNVDVKKIWINTDVTVDFTTALSATVNADVDINPTVVGIGFGYKY